MEEAFDEPIDCFQFRQMPAEFKLKCCPEGVEVPEWCGKVVPRASLLQVSHKKGLIMYPHYERGALAFAPIANLAEKDYLPSEAIGFPGDESVILALCLSADDAHLLVAKSSGKLYAVDLACEQPTKKPFVSKIAKIDSPAVQLLAFDSRVLTVLESGKVCSFSVPELTVIESKFDAENIACASLFDGFIALASSDANEIRIFDCKSEKLIANIQVPFEAGMGISALHVLSKRVMLCSINPAREDDDVQLIVIDLETGFSSPKFRSFMDPCASRPPGKNQFYFASLNDWSSQDLSEFVAVANFNSPDIGVAGRLGKDSEFTTFFIDNDEGLAQLPLINSGKDLTYPLGLAIDFTSTFRHENRQDPDAEALHPAPILWILTTAGHLCPFAMLKCNESGPWPFMKSAPSLQFSPPRPLIAQAPQSDADDTSPSTTLVQPELLSASPSSSSLSVSTFSSEEEDECSESVPATPSKMSLSAITMLQKSAEKLPEAEKPTTVDPIPFKLNLNTEAKTEVKSEAKTEPFKFDFAKTESKVETKPLEVKAETKAEPFKFDFPKTESKVEAKPLEVKAEPFKFEFPKTEVKAETKATPFKFDTPKTEVKAEPFKFDTLKTEVKQEAAKFEAPKLSAPKVDVKPSPSLSSTSSMSVVSQEPTLPPPLKKEEALEKITCNPYQSILLAEVAEAHTAMQNDLHELKLLAYKNSIFLRQNTSKYFQSLEALEQYASKVENLLGSGERVFGALKEKTEALRMNFEDVSAQARRFKAYINGIKHDAQIDWNAKATRLDELCNDVCVKISQLRELLSAKDRPSKATVTCLHQSIQERLQAIIVHLSNLFVFTGETETATLERIRSLCLSSDSLVDEMSALLIKDSSSDAQQAKKKRQERLLEAAKARGARMLIPQARPTKTAAIVSSPKTSPVSIVDDQLVNAFITSVKLTDPVPEFRDSNSGPSLISQSTSNPFAVKKEPEAKQFNFAPTEKKEEPKPFSFTPTEKKEEPKKEEGKPFSFNLPEKKEADVKPFSFITPEKKEEPKPFTFAPPEKKEEPKPFTFAPPEKKEEPKPFAFAPAKEEPKPFTFGQPEKKEPVSSNPFSFKFDLSESAKPADEVKPIEEKKPIPSIFGLTPEAKPSPFSASEAKPSPFSVPASEAKTSPFSLPTNNQSAASPAIPALLTSQNAFAPPSLTSTQSPAFSVTTTPTFGTPAFGQTSLPAFGQTSLPTSNVPPAASTAAPKPGAFAAFAQSGQGLGFSSFSAPQGQAPGSAGGLSFANFSAGSGGKDAEKKDKPGFNFSGFRG